MFCICEKIINRFQSFIIKFYNLFVQNNKKNGATVKQHQQQQQQQQQQFLCCLQYRALHAVKSVASNNRRKNLKSSSQEMDKQVDRTLNRCQDRNWKTIKT
jgi:hypothetical protein